MFGGNNSKLFDFSMLIAMIFESAICVFALSKLVCDCCFTCIDNAASVSKKLI